MHQLSYAAAWYLNEGEKPQRLPRSAHLSQVPVQTFRTADGWIFVMCMNEKFWHLFCDAIGRPDLPDDQRFASAEERRQNRDTLTELVDEELRQHPTAHWLGLLTGKVPVAPVYDLTQALDAPFTQHTGMVRTTTHPARSNLRMLANPLRINGVRPEPGPCASLGADNDILAPAEPAGA
jgi:crotonobetainyl-CoA:carnitine CoA-transferase CaiB-like acyl-CoA transferase